MATHVGKEGTVAVGANTVTEVADFTVTERAELVEDSELSDEWRTFKSGTDVVKEWDASVTCMWDETDTNGQEALTIGASVTLNLYPEGSASTATYKTGTAIVEEIGIAITRGAITQRTLSCRGTGALTQATV